MNGQKPTEKKLMNRDFLLLWQGSAVSTIGNVLYSIAIGIWVYNSTGSTALMGVMTSFTYLVAFLLGPFAGVLIDRMNRRNILVAADAVRGVLMLGIAWFAFHSTLAVWQVLLTAFLAAVCNVFFAPASSTVAVQLVKPADLVRAQSMMQGVTSFVGLIGNAVSGFLVVLFGVPLMILLNGISFLVSAVTEWFIRVPRQSGEGTSLSLKLILRDFRGGFQYLRSIHGLLPVFAAAFLMNLCGSGFGAVLYPWTQAKGMSVTEYGLFLGVESGASVLATLLLSAVRVPAKHRYRLMAVMIVCSFGCNAATMLLRGFLPCTVSNAIGAFANVTFNMLMNAALILMVDEAYRGKALGILTSISQGGVAASMLLYGALSEVWGVQVVALAGAVLMGLPLILLLKNVALKELLTAEPENAVPAQDVGKRDALPEEL
ncbi:MULTISPECIES: MFS transporter [Caproicibacterium]|uniref:MFS transporter n=1 Tax=Caproicibacterium argilliputei TaxID=3030016 RepID=A0AA97H385_9FIRM|nr:MFS transporter [Caproicibacterium argilliputei]WOC32942.1 MFS transporter [Caproicibacterium argilliputei]